MSAMSEDMALEENDRMNDRRKARHPRLRPHRHDGLVLCGELVAMIGLAIAFLAVAQTVAYAILTVLNGGCPP